MAVISYVMSLVVVYVAALIIDALGAELQRHEGPVKAFKVAAYSATPAGWPRS